MSWPAFGHCILTDHVWSYAPTKMGPRLRVEEGWFPQGIWGAIIKRRGVEYHATRQRVTHHAYLSEVWSGGNQCTDCHIHSPSKLGIENSGMRVLEGALQIMKTGVIQECFFVFIFKLRILPNFNKFLWLKCSGRTQHSVFWVVLFTSANPHGHVEFLRIILELLRTVGENLYRTIMDIQEYWKPGIQRILPKVAKLVTFQVYSDGSK